MNNRLTGDFCSFSILSTIPYVRSMFSTLFITHVFIGRLYRSPWLVALG